jgi:hypothetical protein
MIKKKAIQEAEISEGAGGVEGEIDFLAIQETKLESTSDSLCFSIWGGQDCQWAFLPSSGNSGGILSILNKTFATLKFSFTGVGFVRVQVSSIHYLSIYSPFGER